MTRATAPAPPPQVDFNFGPTMVLAALVPYKVAVTWRGEIQAYWIFTSPFTFALCGAMTIEFHSHAPGEACNE